MSATAAVAAAAAVAASREPVPDKEINLSERD
jgi:hypothetical protein